MMVSEPGRWVDDVKDAGGDQFTFHYEATPEPEALIRQIHAAGMKAGMAVKPGTQVEECLQFVSMVDMVLIMTVEPGFGGQSFMPHMMPKALFLRNKFPDLDIQVDGGLSPSTIDIAAKAGVNSIVAGSAVFKPEPGPAESIAILRRSIERFGNGKDEESLTALPSSTKKHKSEPSDPMEISESIYDGDNLTVGASSAPSQNAAMYKDETFKKCVMAWGFG